MPESKAHKLLIKQGRYILQKKGFKKHEIIEGYRWKDYLIDIAGVKDNNLLLIECGTITYNKFKDINDSGKRFIHMPYLNKRLIRDGKPRDKNKHLSLVAGKVSLNVKRFLDRYFQEDTKGKIITYMVIMDCIKGRIILDFKKVKEKR